MLFQIVQGIFFIYTLLLLGRIICSWFPNLMQYRFYHFLTFYTDPYLNIFRRIIPPIGGVVDISPLLAFFALRLVERLLLYFLLSVGL